MSNHIFFSLAWLSILSLACVARGSTAADHGGISLTPTGEVVAGSRATFTFTYTVGSQGLKKGGSLRITTPNDDWSFPLVPHHRYFQPELQRGGKDGGIYSYARCDTVARLASSTKAWVDLNAEVRAPGLEGKVSVIHLVAVVHEDDLVEGDRIEIIYGDKSRGEPGARVARVAPTDKDHFRAYVDTSGSGKFVELPADELKRLRVVAGPVSQFNVVAPAIVRPGKPFTVKIAGWDDYRNRPSGVYVGDLRVSASRPGVQMPGDVKFTAADANHRELTGVRVATAGVLRIVVEPAAGGERSVSNPIWCTSEPVESIYFGDLHVHGMWHEDSIGTPDELYAYGRDVAGLDFMGVTDAGSWAKQGWPEILGATRRHYSPGRFVTFKGFEFYAREGHRNVIYRDCEDEPGLAKLAPNDIKALFDYYRGREVIMIPHHTKVWTDWRFHDPVLEPIAEVYSAWGSGVEYVDPLWHKAVKPEAGIYTALARGYVLGFIGSSDSHSGMPGRSYPADRFWAVNSKGGYACVYAPRLTREAVFDALRARHCYATTGVRMILEFFVNGTSMGRKLTVVGSDRTRRIRVHAIGTALDHLRIIKNNAELVRQDLAGDEIRFEYSDPEVPNRGDFYFVRVVQKDGNTAWSSPVWVE